MLKCDGFRAAFLPWVSPCNDSTHLTLLPRLFSFLLSRFQLFLLSSPLQWMPRTTPPERPSPNGRVPILISAFASPGRTFPNFCSCIPDDFIGQRPARFRSIRRQTQRRRKKRSPDFFVPPPR